jgi:sec-independent protein translocase protein TatC
MRKYRSYAIVVIVIVAAMLDPSPDIFSQCLIGLPIYMLYELSIFIAARVEKNRNKKNTASA